jgi:hypothetical protein
MKLKKLAVASAMAVAALSGQAMAAAPGAFDTPDVEVYLTGASAPQNFMGALAATLFGANTSGFNNFHVYYDKPASGTTGASYRAYYGALQSAFTVNSPTVGSVTLPIGTKVRIINRAKGGSVWGVDPVATRDRNGDGDVTDAGDTPLPIAWMPVVAASGSTGCTTVSGQAWEYECTESGNDSNQADAGNRLPDFGVSDVEPPMFKFPYNLEPISLTLGQLEGFELNTLTWTPTSGLLFGLPATGAVPSGINFNRALYTALLSGLITDWTQVDNTLTGNTQVVVCRRVQGSGTQATYNAYFNNFPCATNSLVAGTQPPLRMVDSAGYTETSTTITVDPTQGLTVIENPSSGNVRDCLSKAMNGGTHTFTYTTDANVKKTVSVNFGPVWDQTDNDPPRPSYRAIGVLSLDSTENNPGTGTNPAGTWSWRAMQGVLPSKTTLRNGQYDFFSELSLQINNEGYASNNTTWVKSPLNSGSSTALKQKRAFMELFIQRAADPAILATMTGAVGNATAALPLQYVPDETTSSGLNTMYVTRQGNACSNVVRYPFPAN